MIQLQGKLPEDREKLLAVLDEIIGSQKEEKLRNYRKNQYFTGSGMCKAENRSDA